MKSEELFRSFSVGAGKDRFNNGFARYGTTIDCKVSGNDTGGGMCVLEVNNTDRLLKCSLKTLAQGFNRGCGVTNTKTPPGLSQR